jgi:hypothetical protein
MNYMINNEASKQVAIEFAKWTILNGMWKSDLTFEEQYECWVSKLDEQAAGEAAGDTVDMEKWDEFEHQLEYMSGAYEE